MTEPDNPECGICHPTPDPKVLVICRRHKVEIDLRADIQCFPRVTDSRYGRALQMILDKAQSTASYSYESEVLFQILGEIEEALGVADD